MNMDPEDLDINLNEVWRACRKIQSTIFQYGFDICSEFCPQDPKGYGLVSESIFLNILGKYKKIIGLSDFELREVSDYFRLRDGRVAYKQFCKVVCDEKHAKSAKTDFAPGLEWNDPMHVNVIPCPEDRRRLCLILIKISQISHLPLLPYFQDYELVSQNVGNVSVAHFSRVLHFMKIPLSDEEFLLLLKRYMKDSYLVNYVAFTTHLQNITDYLKSKGLLANSLQIIKDFPGRIVDLELAELPPVDGTNFASRVFKDICNHPKDNKNDCEVVVCIQKHIHKNRIRVSEFLEGYDPLRTGTITKNQFERGLYLMGIGKYVSQRDFKILCGRYIDPVDTNRIMWRAFENDIDSVFTIKNLDKMPKLVVASPPKYIEKMPRPGQRNWDEVDDCLRDICEDALLKIQTKIRARRLHLHPYFRSYDKLNSGHVRCGQVHQIFICNGILLSNAEITALQMRYGNELGFNYSRFLEDADPAEYGVPKLQERPTELQMKCPTLATTNGKVPDHQNEKYIIKVLSKAKRQAVTKSIPIIDFLQDYDHHREAEILESDFIRALDNANIKMSAEEINLLCKLFRSRRRGCCILYRDFCKALDEVFIQIETTTGDKEITAVPLIHLANMDCLDCFLNFEERTVCSQGLQKLATRPDEISNLSHIFTDFDKEKCGSITQGQLLRALTVREMHYAISSREFEVIFKCFGVRRGLHLEFNYREFLKILNILFQNGQVKRYI